MHDWHITFRTLIRSSFPGDSHVSSATLSSIQEQIDRVPFWWHSIDIGGVVTPGLVSMDRQQQMLRDIRLPDLKGKSVLDIGTFDGFFAFEAERLGATRVVALD